jgi:uncharacterized membrane protein YbhN (UPF0104 family)
MPSVSQIGANGKLRHAWRLSIAFMLVSLAVLGVLVLAGSDLDVDELQGLLLRVTPRLILVLLLLSCANFLLRTGRWLWFTHTLGLSVPWRDNAACYLGGFAMGVTPGRLGEFIRLWQLRRDHGVTYHRTLPLIIGDRVSDLLAVVVLALGAGLMTTGAPVPAVIAAAALVVISNALLRHPGPLIAAIDGIYGALGRAPRLFAAARRTLRTGRDLFSARNSLIAGLASLAAWFAECLAFFLLLSALDTGVTLSAATFVYSFATLVGALSFLPGGLGGFEATAVVMLSAYGVDLGSAALATTIIRLTTLWFSVALGSAVLGWLLLGRKLIRV